MPKKSHPLRLIDAADPEHVTFIEHPEFFDLGDLEKWARENPQTLNIGSYSVVRDLGTLVVSIETLRKVRANYE